MAHTLISCVIPCYKSAQTIGDVIDEIETTIDERDGYDYEIILVNDGSPDNGATIARLRELAAADKHLVVVNLARNFGQHPALMAGLAQVRGEYVVCLDDDGQTPADEMFKLIEKVENGYDIAYALYDHKQHAAWRNWGSRFNTWCNHRFMGIPKDLQDNSYFACKRYVIDSALNYTNPYPFVEGLLFQSVQTYCNVPVHHRNREIGESGYNLHKLISLWLNGFTAFSVLPLRAATVIGFIFALVGFIFALVVIIQKFAVPGIDDGWSSLMSGILLIGGIMMLIMGMMGEYVGRIYISLNHIPQYVVRDVTDPRVPKAESEPHGKIS